MYQYCWWTCYSWSKRTPVSNCEYFHKFVSKAQKTKRSAFIDVPDLSSAGRVLYIVFRSTASLDVPHVHFLIQDLDLQKCENIQIPVFRQLKLR